MKFVIEQAVEILERTPGVLHAMLGGLSNAWVCNNYGPETFSPFDVVGHLILGERTDWMVRTRIILEHGEAQTFEPFDRYAMYEENKGKKIGELLATFTALRKENLKELRALHLTPRQLALKGRHPEFGPVTLEAMLATWVTHDLNHIHQIAKCLAYQYQHAVGPWMDYQGIFKDLAGY